ncbi:MAG: hypothetical protein NT178_17715 [Proteobacteria bacterium]|nr:hypothetical protein [Pseudomonadota bacterium]
MSKKNEVRRVLKGCFSNPSMSLGKTERNCEVKVLFLTLWELGWDPVTQLFFNFQVDKEAIGEGAYMRGAPDIIIGNRAGILMVGDAKHWQENLNNYFEQVTTYQKALGLTRAFITNGHRWVIFGSGREGIVFDEEFNDPDYMIDKLKPWIGPDSTNGLGVLAYNGVFEKGLSLHNDNSSVDVDAKWNPENPNYTIPKSQQFLRLLNQLVDENPDLLARKARKNIFIHCRKGKLIEYSPETNTIAKTVNDHQKKLFVPEALSKDYHSLIKSYKRIASDPERIIEKLREIVKVLKIGQASCH